MGHVVARGQEDASCDCEDSAYPRELLLGTCHARQVARRTFLHAALIASGVEPPQRRDGRWRRHRSGTGPQASGPRRRSRFFLVERGKVRNVLERLGLDLRIVGRQR